MTTFRVVSGTPSSLPDMQAFVRQIADGNALDERGAPFFDDSGDVYVARAPGRLDVMGGIADYSGSLVLQWPMREATLAAVQPDASRAITVFSSSPQPTAAATRTSLFEMRVDDLLTPEGGPIAYEVAQRLFARDEKTVWAAYVAGAFLVLMRERGSQISSGARIFISSNVPEGSGVSSSAALEVSVMTALCAALRIRLAPPEIARLCQKVENFIAGAACGIMDQMASACGVQGRLLALVCQPAEIVDTIDLPESLCFWGIDSGVRHSVRGSSYTAVRTGAFMGYRMIAALENLRVTPASDGTVRVDDPKWSGYLCNIPPPDFESRYHDRLPESIAGDTFLDRYGGLTDRVVRVDPGLKYAVRMPTAHPVYENARVHLFAAELQRRSAAADYGILGTLMRQSHESYNACGLGSDATDLIVSLVTDVGPKRGLLGAKITGGGSGGTVVVAGDDEGGKAARALDEVVSRFGEKTGHMPAVFSGTSPGASQAGVVGLTPHD